jgi:hypothetical protein
MAAALDVKFLHDPVLHNGNAGFLRGDIDEDFVAHSVLLNAFHMLRQSLRLS